jgi:DNA-binding MarR family transcriptional regulator
MARQKSAFRLAITACDWRRYLCKCSYRLAQKDGGDFVAGTTMTDVDIREVAQCSCLRLRRITRRVTQIYDHHLQPSGLTINQFGLLARLYGAWLRRELLPMSALAERQGMDPTTLNRSLKPLEAAGLIGKGVDPADQRVRVVLITEQGINKLRETVPLWRKAEAQINQALGLDTAVALNGLLEVTYARLAK